MPPIFFIFSICKDSENVKKNISKNFFQNINKTPHRIIILFTLTKGEEISFFFRNFFSFLSYYICLFNTSFHLDFDSKHHLYLIIKSFKSANYSIYYFFLIYMIIYSWCLFVLFMLFLKIDFKKFLLKEKGIRILSSATFGVYLIHNNNYFNDLVFKNIFINVPTDNVIIFILCFYFSIASVYATCTVIELLRIRFFCAIKGCFVLASKTKSNLLDNWGEFIVIVSI